MAVVFSVIFSSILEASIHKLSLSMSTKTGVQLSQTILLVVATKEKGVVIISPFKAKAFIAICKATVPLVTNNKCFTPKRCFNFISKSEAKGPILVSHCLCQMPSTYFLYSSKGGRKGFVTGIMLFFFLSVKL